MFGPTARHTVADGCRSPQCKGGIARRSLGTGGLASSVPLGPLVRKHFTDRITRVRLIFAIWGDYAG
jgi:hypothetical protein